MRASVAGRVATLLLVALSWAALDRVANSEELRQFATSGWLALAAGTLVASLTPVALLFRRVSVWPVALLVAGVMAYSAYQGGATDLATYRSIWIIAGAVLGLDLRWVSRLRVWVFVSGIFLIPAVVVSGREPLVWVAAWLAGAFVTLWLLNADVHRAVADTSTPTRQVARRPLDLIRVLATGLALGLVVGLVMDSPGFTYRPLERLVRYLPFRPDLDLTLDLDLDLRTYEVDANGFEVRYHVTPKGQRFVLDPRTNEPLAVVERDGVDEFLTFEGEVVATIPDGASTLIVAGDDGSSTTWSRDDDGWYVEVGGVRYRAALADGRALLFDAGRTIVDPTTLDDPAIAVPPASVLNGTVGENTQIWRYGDIIEVDGWRQGRRTYRLYTDELEVDVRRRGDRYEYRWNADRSTMTVHVERLRQSGSLDIDRDGNAFDYLESLLTTSQQVPAETDDGTSWRDRAGTLASVVVVVVVLAAVGAFLWRSRRRGPLPDRGWAEGVLARLEAHGSRQTERRDPAESVVAYLDRLAREVDGDDDRLRAVGEVLDDALYGTDPIAVDERDRVEATVDELTAARR